MEAGTMNVAFPRADDVVRPDNGQPAAGQQAGASQRTRNEPEYGLIAVVAGLVMLASLDIAALALLSHNVNGAVAVIGAISSPVVAIVSAYFGIKVGAKSGSASADAANKARTKAETESKSLLGHMAPEEAKPVMRELGIPLAD
jgi:hypothetical protein